MYVVYLPFVYSAVKRATKLDWSPNVKFLTAKLLLAVGTLVLLSFVSEKIVKTAGFIFAVAFLVHAAKVLLVKETSTPVARKICAIYGVLSARLLRRGNLK
jgi:hypothetical protein